MAEAAGCCSNKPWLSLLIVFFVAAAIGKEAVNDWSSRYAKDSAIGIGGLKLNR